MKETQNFTKGNILTSLVRFALPVLAALFLQTMYGAVDMLVVGQFATAADVSAVSTGSWLMQLITSFVVGIAMGTTVLLGRRLGEGKPEESRKNHRSQYRSLYHHRSGNHLFYGTVRGACGADHAYAHRGL